MRYFTGFIASTVLSILHVGDFLSSHGFTFFVIWPNGHLHILYNTLGSSLCLIGTEIYKYTYFLWMFILFSWIYVSYTDSLVFRFAVSQHMLYNYVAPMYFKI